MLVAFSGQTNKLDFKLLGFFVTPEFAKQLDASLMS
jgi:hypothetical protein